MANKYFVIRPIDIKHNLNSREVLQQRNKIKIFK